MGETRGGIERGGLVFLKGFSIQRTKTGINVAI